MKRILTIMMIGILLICSTMFCVSCSGEGGLFGSKPKSVTVTLVPNGGKITAKTLVGKAGDPMELPTLTREGFTFAGWYDDFDVVDQTVYPSSDMTLTARYYADEDFQITASAQSKLNDVGTDGWYFDYEHFSDDDLANVKLMQKNPDSDLDIVITMEAYVNVGSAYTWFGNTPTVTYRIAGAKKELAKVAVTNRDDYQTYTMSCKTKTSELTNERKGILQVTQEETFAATGCSKNVKLELTATIKAGSLV